MGDLNLLKITSQIIQGCVFIAFTTFNLAHWIFAFSYFALSYRLELIAKGLPEDTQNCRLNIANIIVCLFNLVIPAIVWLCRMKGEGKVADITFDVE
jgi:hypothetical protein